MQLELLHTTYTLEKTKRISKMAHILSSSPYSLGNSVPYMGNSVPYMGNSVPYMGNSVPYMGNSVPYMGNSVPYMGNSVPYMGNSVPYMGNHVPYMGCCSAHMGATVPYMGDIMSTENVPYMGRSVMPDFSTAQKYSKNATWNPAFNTDLQKALWTAQVLAFWLTDGVAYQKYDGMRGLVTSRGHNPSDPTPVLDSSGYAKTDLTSLLNPPGNKDPKFVKGPDSLWGDEAEAEDVLVEYINTGKFFGKTLPSSFTKTKAILETLISAVSSPNIEKAKSNRAAGVMIPSKTEAKQAPCFDLDDAAYAARADCPKPRPTSGGGGGGSVTPSVPPKSKFAEGAAKDTEEEKEDNTMLYVGLGLLGLAAIGGVAYYMHNKNKSAIDKSKTTPSSSQISD